VWAGQRRLDRERRAEHASYLTLAAVSMAGVVAHILMDLPTSYGTRLLSPFSWRWHAVDLMPIVDIYLLLVLAAGLIVGWRWARLKRRLAFAALIFLAFDYGVRTAAHQRAVRVTALLMAPILPAPCADAVKGSPIDAWPLETLADRRDRAARRCLMEIAAIPTFVSPFRWQMVVRLSDSYQIVDLDLMDARLSNHAAGEGPLAIWRGAVRYPDQWTPAVLRAASSRVGRIYLDFSRFPAASSVLNDDNSATVSWADMRFAGSAAPVPPPRAGLFTATVTVDGSGRAISERLGR
jgi:inner membrane protein